MSESPNNKISNLEYEIKGLVCELNTQQKKITELEEVIRFQKNAIDNSKHDFKYIMNIIKKTPPSRGRPSSQPLVGIEVGPCSEEPNGAVHDLSFESKINILTEKQSDKEIFEFIKTISNSINDINNIITNYIDKLCLHEFYFKYFEHDDDNNNKSNAEKINKINSILHHIIHITSGNAKEISKYAS